MPLTFIDAEGLTSHAQLRDELVQACLRANPGVVVEEDQRLALLASLVEGAGVRIVTGPLGRDFWGLASVEVQVHVWPDDYDWRERYDEWAWALVQEGAGALVASHIRHGKTPTVRHRLYGAFVRAQGHMLKLHEISQAVLPLVHEDTKFSLVDISTGLSQLQERDTLLALDWEWHRGTKEPVGLAISSSESNSYVPVWASDVDNRASGQAVRDSFGEFLKSGGLGILHGGRADLGTQLPFDPVALLEGDYRAHDTMVMAYLLGDTALGLKPLSRKYLGRDPIENDYEWAEQPARFTGRYAAAGDTRNTYDLFRVLETELDKLPTQKWIYENVERPLVPIIASMEKYGTPVDMEAVRRTYTEHVRIEEGLRKSVRDNYGRDLSDDLDTRHFITDFGFADPGTLDQRVISLNPHWCIDLIMEYRRTRTRRRNFLKRVIQRWVEAGRPADFRVYPRFNQAGSIDEGGPSAPRTGRLSSADPNLMNQPHAIRDIYVPPPGCVWWSYDYSGLELRIAAGLSQDPVMLSALREGRDLHGEFRTFIQQKTGKDVGRVPAKTGNFEQLYEGGANQLVRILAKQRAFISNEDAQAIVESHHDLFRRYHEWGMEQVKEARLTGYARTLDGRLRQITEYSSSDPAELSHGDRAAQNHPVQGTGADKVKQVMHRIVKEVLSGYKDAHMCIQVHDELDGWVSEDVDLEKFDRDMRSVMESIDINGLPLKVEGGFGKTWAEAH